VQGEPLPALVINEISPGRLYVHSGPDGLENPRVQFDVYAATFAAARTIATALLHTLEQPETVGVIAFSKSILAARSGPRFEDIGGGEKPVRIRMDFFLWFSPSP
jgi:hypothetical protein